MIGRVTVELGGKSRRVVFGQNAWYLFCKLHKIAISDIGKYFGDVVSNPDSFRDLTFCAIQAADLSSGDVVDYNQYTVGDWLDEAPEETVQVILDTLVESRSTETGKVSKKK